MAEKSQKSPLQQIHEHLAEVEKLKKAAIPEAQDAVDKAFAVLQEKVNQLAELTGDNPIEVMRATVNLPAPFVVSQPAETGKHGRMTKEEKAALLDDYTKRIPSFLAKQSDGTKAGAIAKELGADKKQKLVMGEALKSLIASKQVIAKGERNETKYFLKK